MSSLRSPFIVLIALELLLAAPQARAAVNVVTKDKLEVFAGEDVEIPCSYTFNKMPGMVMIQWFVGSGGDRVRIYYSDDKESMVDKDTGYTDRIMVKDTGNHALALTLRGVRLGDEREFICQVNGMSQGSAEGRTHVKVFDPPETPMIEGVHSGISVSYKTPSKIASCETREGYPRPNITWYRNNVALQPKPDVVNVVTLVTQESSGLFSVQSNLHYKVEMEDKDALFYCQISYSVPGAVRTSDSQRINVTVYYPTTAVEVWRESPKGLVKEGDNVEIRCRGNGNPAPPYSFYRKQEPDAELESSLDSLILNELTREDTDVYECRAMDLDSYAEVTGEVQLTVHYLDPVVVIPTNPKVLSKGESMTATCNALSSVETTTLWFKNGKELRQGSELLLEDASFDTAGEYACEVMAPSLPGLQRRATVHVSVQGAPEIRDSEQVTQREEAENKSLNLTCEARGFPQPKITWSIAGTEKWQEVYHKVMEGGVRSVVTVKVTGNIDATCNATNDLGTKERVFSVRAVHRVASAAANTADGSGVIIVVIIVSILLLAILASVLYFLYKKGKLPCGRSGKQDITKEAAGKNDIVVEMKTDKTEEAVLLKGVNGEKATNEQ